MSLFKNDNVLPTEVQFIGIICSLGVGYENHGKILYALYLAIKVHDGQKRYTTGENYICHPIRVVTKVIEILQFIRFDVSPDLLTRIIILALLHDVVEDNKRYRRRNFAHYIERELDIEDLARDLMAITHLKTEDYGDYLERFRDARWYMWLIKFVDFVDNYQDIHLDKDHLRLAKRIAKCRDDILPFLEHATIYNRMPSRLAYVVDEVHMKLLSSVSDAETLLDAFPQDK